TQVNGCRYCAYYHARMALREGMDHAEVQAILQGMIGTCPPEEETAILYAQHWAETAADPDPEVRAKVVEVYGEEKTQAIELFLQMIRMGNYMGNTFDYFLYRISGGRWGNH
ncbi:MAG: carboxymuconolactone decarboxylase family protein, partial [Anaerolineae bacterium]|nr:carboxymuconolactone decarboxylase family protein [Anaerolineae bacterium]